MKKAYLIGLYNINNELVGYFHNEEEIDKYIELLKGMNVDTNGWKRFNHYFET